LETQVLPQPDTDTLRSIAAPWHTMVVLAVAAGIAYRGATHADQMRAAVNLNRIGIYERTIVSEWLVLGLVLVGVYLHGSSLLTVLGSRWRSAREVLRDLGIALLFLIVTITITSIIGGHGGSRDSSASFLIPHGGREMAVWIALSISAGLCEEAVYRGYLQKQFIALTRNVPAGIVLSGAAFGAAHAYQGLRQALQIGLLGVMSGILAHWRKSLRPVMIAHTLQDVLGGFIRH
jgi:uncharacterized protein